VTQAEWIAELARAIEDCGFITDELSLGEVRLRWAKDPRIEVTVRCDKYGGPDAKTIRDLFGGKP